MTTSMVLEENHSSRHKTNVKSNNRQIFTSDKEVMLLVACDFFICLQNNSQSYGQILIKSAMKCWQWHMKQRTTFWW